MRLEIAGIPYRLFPVVQGLKLKQVRTFPERPATRSQIEEVYRVDFDEALLPEDSWEGDLGEDEYEVEKILDVRSGRKTRYGRIQKQYLVQWRDFGGPSWTNEVDLNCGSLLQEFDRNRVRRNRFEVIQSYEEKAEEY